MPVSLRPLDCPAASAASGRTYEKGQTNVATARIQGAECGEKSVRSRQETQEMETEVVNVVEFPWFWHDR